METQNQYTLFIVMMLLGLTGLVIVGIRQTRSLRKKKAEEESTLWETGATQFLSMVWSTEILSAAQPPSDKSLIRQRLDSLVVSGENLSGTVCGEEISLTLNQQRGAPYTLFGFVTKPETERALLSAHRAMCTYEQQELFGLVSLDFDIRATG